MMASPWKTIRRLILCWLELHDWRYLSIDEGWGPFALISYRCQCCPETKNVFLEKVHDEEAR